MSKSLAIKKELGLDNEEWYQAMKEDCSAIITEHEFQIRDTAAKAWWEVGQRLIENSENIPGYNKYGERIIENLARDLGKSPATIFSAVQFYKRFPAESYDEAQKSFPWGKDASWYAIRQHYLGSGKRDEEERIRHSFKRPEILGVLKEWLISHSEKEYSNDEEIENDLKDFDELLISRIGKLIPKKKDEDNG